MERMIKRILSIALLVSAGLAYANNKTTPTLVYRSQGFHSDRQKMVGMVDHTHRYDMESWYGTFDLGIGYMKSFREDRIAKCLFGDDLICGDCDNTIKVQGSKVSSRDEKAWLADYLYLNCEFDGSFKLAPSIQNVVVDLDFYLGLDEWASGLYFRAFGPINWTKWETKFCSTSSGETDSCSSGYMTPSGDEVLNSTITQYFAGTAPASVDGVTFQGLKFAKMPNCDRTRTGFADLRLELGWDFLQDEDYHLGLALQVAAPTGNKREACFVMDPVVGNGNHWELGGVVTGHYRFWNSEDSEKHFGFYVDANLMHLFKADEQRTFDIKHKDNSRYMLASKLTNTVVNNLKVDASAAATSATATAPAYQFANEYAPVANLTTADMKVSIGLQADVTAMFNFTSRGFGWDLGYNFYGRTCESFDCPKCPDKCNSDSIIGTKNQNTWALKGNSRSFGFEGALANTVSAVDAKVALSGTDSAADIHKGSNTDDNTSANYKRNFSVDAAGFAYGDATVDGTDNNRLIHTPTSLGGFNVDANQIKSSLTPVFINNCDVELQQTRGISHTVFTHLSYTFDRDNWVPYIGLGGSAEFGQGASCCETKCDDKTSTSCSTSKCDTKCDSCVDCSLSQWAVWVKGGVSFN